MKQKISTVVAGLLLATPVFSMDMDQVQVYGYGEALYSKYDYLPNYQSKPKTRAKVDLERFVLAPQFILDDNIKIVSEIEFEHGGTGVTKEYDTLDEFGEFEADVEKGGEVVTEEAYIDINYKPWLNFKIGHSVVPIGLNSQRHLPSLYLSTHRNLSETTILPSTWHETGITAYGKIGENWNYQAMSMTGLNSEFFDSHHWIRSGDQKQFEFANADNLAFALRVDYGDITASHIGASVYMGNSNQNRNKAKLDSDGQVSLYEVHGVYDKGNIRLRAMGLLGTLSDSEKITQANRNLSNKLGAVRTPVGSEALSYFVEAGYDIAPIIGYGKSIIPFVKYDYVDSMHKTEGFVQNDDRYENKIITVGVDYFLNPNVVLKADYSQKSFGSASGIDDLNSFSLYAGYQF